MSKDTQREMVARIIDPDAFRTAGEWATHPEIDVGYGKITYDAYAQSRKNTLAMADAILLALSSQNPNPGGEGR